MTLPSASPAAVRRSLSLDDPRLYLAVAGMVLGNLALPWAVHRFPGAGAALLPLFFFTLIAGWRFGVAAGVLTGVLSPLANHLLTGLPPAPAYLLLMGQSAVLGALAGSAGARRPRPGLGQVMTVVLVHQALVAWPTLAQAGVRAAWLGFELRLPGILLQILGGCALLRLLAPRPARPDAG
jgi:hypothetical protein